MAQTISSKFQAQLANNLRWARGYVYSVENNAYFHDNDNLISFKITTDLQKGAAIYGNTICKYAETTAQNPGNFIKPNIGDHIDIYTGLTLDISLPTEEVEYLNQGRFTLYDIKYDEDNETFTTYHYDDMVKFNVKYYKNGESYPMSLAAFAANLCSRVGLELGSTTFPNSTFMIDEPNVAANEYTFRDLLGWVAELAGGNAVIGRDNKVYIKTYSDTSVFTITPDIYVKAKRATTFGPLNSVAMIREALGDTVAYPDPLPIYPLSYKIIDNMVAYDQREDIIEEIYNEINGMTYVPFELDWRATGHLDFMDKITIVDTNSVSFDSYVMNQVLSFNGALSEQLSAVAYSPAEAAIKNAGTTTTKGKLTEAKVDKVSGEITLVSSEVDNLGTDMAQVLLDVDSINLTVADHTGAIGALQLDRDAFSIRMTDAESNIGSLELTTDGLVIDIEKYNNGELTGTKYTFDGTAATFYGGGLTIKNLSNVDVLKADLNGNLTLKGTLDSVGGTFSGSLSAATGTFAGSLSAATGSFSGNVSTGALTATGGTIGGFTIGSTKLSSSSSGRIVSLNDSSSSSYYGLQVTNPVGSGFETYYQGGSIINYQGGSAWPLTLNGNTILTTASTATASTKGPITISYDAGTNTLYIGS